MISQQVDELSNNELITEIQNEKIDNEIELDLNQINEYLTCPICHDVFYEPITLICQHNFCKNCLTDAQSYRCPMCRLRAFIPPAKNNALDNMARTMHPDQYEKKKIRIEELTKKKQEETENKKKEEDIKNKIWREVVNSINDSYRDSDSESSLQIDTNVQTTNLEQEHKPKKEYTVVKILTNLVNGFIKQPFLHIFQGLFVISFMKFAYNFSFPYVIRVKLKK